MLRRKGSPLAELPAYLPVKITAGLDLSGENKGTSHIEEKQGSLGQSKLSCRDELFSSCFHRAVRDSHTLLGALLAPARDIHRAGSTTFGEEEKAALKLALKILPSICESILTMQKASEHEKKLPEYLPATTFLMLVGASDSFAITFSGRRLHTSSVYP